MAAATAHRQRSVVLHAGGLHYASEKAVVERVLAEPRRRSCRGRQPGRANGDNGAAHAQRHFLVQRFRGVPGRSSRRSAGLDLMWLARLKTRLARNAMMAAIARPEKICSAVPIDAVTPSPAAASVRIDESYYEDGSLGA